MGFAHRGRLFSLKLGRLIAYNLGRRQPAMENLLLATSNGLAVYEHHQQGWQAAHRGLAGQEILCLIAREGVILAGTRQGVWRSDDLGQSWQAASTGLSQPHVRWLAYHPDISDFEV